MRLYSFYESIHYYYYVMELMRGGTLAKFLAEQSSPASEEAVLDYARQILLAVAYCHRHNISHGDVKMENLMFADPQRKVLKLIDFGLAQNLTSMSPTERQNAIRGDMRGVGRVMYTLINGPMAYRLEENRLIPTIVVQIARKIFSKQNNMTGGPWRMISEGTKDLIMRLLEYDGRPGPTPAEVFAGYPRLVLHKRNAPARFFPGDGSGLVLMVYIMDWQCACRRTGFSRRCSCTCSTTAIPAG